MEKEKMGSVAPEQKILQQETSKQNILKNQEENKNPEWTKEDFNFADTLRNHFLIETEICTEKALDELEIKLRSGRGIKSLSNSPEKALLEQGGIFYNVEVCPPEVSRPMEISMSSRYTMIDENKIKEDVEKNGIFFKHPDDLKYFLVGEESYTNYDRIVWQNNMPTIISRGISRNGKYHIPDIEDESITSLNRLEEITSWARKYRQEKEERINKLKEKISKLKEKIIELEVDLKRQDIGIEMLEKNIDKLKNEQKK